MNALPFFLLAIVVSIVVTALLGAGSFGIDVSEHAFTFVLALVPAIAVAVVILLRSQIAFAKYKNKEMKAGELADLLGIEKMVMYDNYILSVKGYKVVCHAFFKITNIPYLIDDLDKEKKVFITGNFVRILSTLNFPFELIPRIMPVPASTYLNQINKEIDNLKLTLSAEGSTASPRRQARLRYLERIAQRLLEGEGTRDVSFACHIMVEGKNQTEMVRELEANAKTLMSALESGLNVRAERLAGARMLEFLREFFPASVKVSPPKANRLLAWDLAYLIPLAKPKLPPLEKLLHGVYLGRTVAGGIVCLDINRYANPHIAVLGKSGYGKSTTVKTLVSRMFDLLETNILIIDYAGEYASWVQSRSGTVVDMRTSGINPFELGRATLTDRIRQLIDTFSKLSELTLPQRNVLSYYLMKAYDAKGYRASDPATWKNEPPTIADVIDLIEESLSKFRMGKQLTGMALIEKLAALSSGPIGIFSKSTFSVSDLTGGFVCIDLSKVTSAIMKDMIAYTVLQHIDSEMRLNGVVTKVRQVVVLDEAWKLCRDEDSLPVTIIKEGRKYGYSLIVSSQDATADLAESILANAGTVVIHHTEHPKYLRFFETSYSMTVQEISRVQNAPIGEALVKIGDDPRPFFVRVEMEEVNISANPPHSPDPANILAPLESFGKNHALQTNGNISANSKRLLDEITRDPGNTTTYYYKSLMMSAHLGNQAKKELESQGMIEAKELPRTERGRGGRGLQLTAKGRQALGLQEDSRHGGVIHKSMVRLIAKKFGKHKVDIEYPVGEGKTTDIVIDGRIAIEVETRDFSESNISKNLSVGFEKVIVVCQSKGQAAKFRSKADAIFQNEPRIMITDLKSLMNSIEMVAR